MRINKKQFVIAFVVIIAGWGMLSRHLASIDLHRLAEAHAVPNVVTIHAKAGANSENITLPANVQAWHEAPIFARTNGYVKRWVTDIGTEVKAGDLIAEIETPEVDAQLDQVQADLMTARANNELAQTTARRWVRLLRTNSVSKQETDEKISDAKAKEALMKAAQANFNRLEQLESFKRVVAPFDGMITARNVDNGDLINAGSSTSAKEMFHIADVQKLRVYVQVPQTYAIALKPGFESQVHFSEYPGKSFPAKLTGIAGALDPITRTLLLEFELDNPEHTLFSGGYAEVAMNIPLEKAIITLPVNTLLFHSQGLQVAVVVDNKVNLKTITISRDFGNEFEVGSGITVGEQIIVNPPDSLETGQQVNITSSSDGEQHGTDKK